MFPLRSQVVFPRSTKEVAEIVKVHPGESIFFSQPGTENYYTNALPLLVQPSCVVISLQILIKMLVLPRSTKKVAEVVQV